MGLHYVLFGASQVVALLHKDIHLLQAPGFIADANHLVVLRRKLKRRGSIKTSPAEDLGQMKFSILHDPVGTLLNLQALWDRHGLQIRHHCLRDRDDLLRLLGSPHRRRELCE